jgi:hypothetical protein
MKTAIQQLIEDCNNKIQKLKDKKELTQEQKTYCQAEYSLLMKIVLDLEINYLPIEKQNIVEAFIDGGWDTSGEQDENFLGEKYYTENFTK